MASVADLTSELKNNMEALEKLRLRRRDIKKELNEEGLHEREEGLLAKELASIGKAIEALQNDRQRIYDALEAAAR